MPSRTRAAALAVCLGLVAAACGGREARRLTLATTTSVANSGLLDVLERGCRDEHGITLRAHLVGSGLALRMIEGGDAEVAITHAPRREAEFLSRHPEWYYRKIMFNDFVVVGPATDPAKIGGSADAMTAMRRIAETRATFVSRGDNSGTHEREQELWKSAGRAPPRARRIVSGQGMAATLRVADQIGAYTLTDRATYEQLRRVIDLRLLHEGDPSLVNTYAVVIPGNSNAHAAVFARWMVSGGGRERVANYTVGGEPAFSVWPLQRPNTHPADLPR